MAENKPSNKQLVEEAVQGLVSTGVVPRVTGNKLEFNTKIPADGIWWKFTERSDEVKCTLWKTFTYRGISKRLPKEEQFIPQGCQECYKVVVRPKTYKQLLALEKLQQKLKLVSKCGIEEREVVQALYGGYFYCRGLEQGQEIYSTVRKAVDADQALGPDIGVILKRGCTEFELTYGDSSKWKVSKRQKNIEQMVNERVGFIEACNELTDITTEQLADIHRTWEGFAYKFDPTYDGELTYPRCTTYHDKE